MMFRNLIMGRWTAILVFGLAISCGGKFGGELSAQTATETAVRSFAARGVVLKTEPEKGEVVIRHETITNYMDAMTMPFRVKDRNELSGLQPGDQITFQLEVTDEESWIEKISKVGRVALDPAAMAPDPAKAPVAGSEISLLDYKFTNELGQAVSFHDFRGQALAITFFYTRCPLPEFCPRLSRNFQEASQKLEQRANIPTNWHFISVTFDPDFDSPETLQNYGNSYHYNPQHWSFFTGPHDKIAELARGAGVQFQWQDGTINHNFRTLIVDPQCHLQTIFPVAGDLSDQIVTEIIKAMKPVGRTAQR
jgi:protein SCO1/2